MAVRAEGYALHAPLMMGKELGLDTTAGIPQAHSATETGRRHHLTVGMERHVVHLGVMAFQQM